MRLAVEVPVLHAEEHAHVGLLEGEPHLVGIRRQEVAHPQESPVSRWQPGSRAREPAEAHPAAQDGDHLAAVRQPAGEDQHRQEDEQPLNRFA